MNSNQNLDLVREFGIGLELSFDEKQRLKTAFYSLITAAACDNKLLGQAIKMSEIEITSKEVDSAVIDYMLNQVSCIQQFCDIKRGAAHDKK